MTAEVEKKVAASGKAEEQAAQEHEHEHNGGCCDHDHEHEHDHEDSDEEEEEEEENEQEGEGERGSINRNEKKARKLLTKLGLKLVPGIERVTIKRSRMIFAIANPTVYKTASDSYVVFGEAKVEDAGFQAQAMAAQRLAAASKGANGQTGEDASDEKTNKLVVEEGEGEGEEEVDAEGVDEKDIRIVMEQTSVSRAKAIKTLKSNNNDIVNTIMELTM